MPLQTDWIEVTCRIPAALLEETSAYLVELSGNGVCQDNQAVDTFDPDTILPPPQSSVRCYFTDDDSFPAQFTLLEAFLERQRAAYPEQEIPLPSTCKIRQEDWANSWKAHFRPARIGRRLVIRPTWENYDPAPDDLVIVLDPGMAFGTGTHPTTKLCLEALEASLLGEQPDGLPLPVVKATVLDVGTGSGILAIAAARLGASRVLAVDIDPVAVDVARDNCARNGVTATVMVNSTPLAAIHGTFTIVLANILAEDLVQLAISLSHRVAPGGLLLLSGILVEREAFVVEGFQPTNLTHLATTRDDEWSCLVFGRRG